MAKILYDRDTVLKLKRMFEVSDVTVYAALNGQTQSERARRIRAAAIKLGCAYKGEVMAARK